MANHMITDMKNRYYQTSPITIETRRWDPITAISSTSLATLTNMAASATGIVLKPLEEYHKSQANPSPYPSPLLSNSRDPSISAGSCSQAHSTAAPTAITSHTTSSDLASSNVSLAPSSQTAGSTPNVPALALASGKSASKILGNLFKGVLLDIPLAATEGMRAVPRLYGAEVVHQDAITDWTSGFAVAGRAFGQGMYGAATDIFVETYRGKKEEGAVGVAKGLGKGVVSLAMKTGSAGLGLVAYPSTGVYRSVRARVKDGTRRRIEEMRLEEGRWLVEKRGLEEDVVEMFLSL